MAQLVTSQQFQAPSILESVQMGLRSRGEIQRQEFLTQDQENKLNLQAAAEDRAARNLATQQRALGVGPEPKIDEKQETAQKRLIAENPEVAKKILAEIGVHTQQQAEKAAVFANSMRGKLPEQQVSLIKNRIKEIESRGGDASQTKSLLSTDDNEKSIIHPQLTPEIMDSVMADVEEAALTALQRAQLEQKRESASASGGASEKSFAPVTLVNSDGDKMLYFPAFNPKTGEARLEKADLPTDFVLSTETPKEQRQADIVAAEAKKIAEVTGKGKAARQQVHINKGIIAADNMVSLKRVQLLLLTEKTGGFHAMSLKAKQLFGIESANEAELSNKLGKAVLAQLKTIFGTAFSEGEGRLLQDMEAGYGKSTEGNKRLIERSIIATEKRAMRGIKAAESAGDLEAADIIRKGLIFTLEPEEETKKEGEEETKKGLPKFKVEVIE